METKWSEYKYESNPINLEEGVVANNKEAIACVKSNYYQTSDSPGNSFWNLKMDITESSLERHTYIMLGESSIITYTAKWF